MVHCRYFFPITLKTLNNSSEYIVLNQMNLASIGRGLSIFHTVTTDNTAKLLFL